ncbi:gliding motility-associated C-terminal domain-containing protein [Flavobacterium sp. NKUCC04_CG]|uniref:gliding motility-associated C-terminal domain-containing protein n=1 Tax=Flavobacterium sp. NKUCC04_CG TaxID=2842121 RepID=UPI001C5A966E|nr:gliding motility-associated C-terminal domain-containing protein [Flavobacterium sp. NKUCC04_CG]MBW3520137.1 gliding motility-associated C-terminal domain-containing protein [Flavobacterium sp. NKUCC04_CG]
MNSKRISVITAMSLLFIPSVMAQTVNKGQMVILPKTEISTLLDLQNKESGVIINDGVFYIYKDFHNDGLFDYSTNATTGYAVFQNNTNQAQLLTGNKPSSFYDVLFDNNKQVSAFDLKNDMSIGGTANFLNGVVLIDSLKGALVFQKDALAINVSNASHADGEVEKIGNKAFEMPIGQDGFYRRAIIGTSENIANSFLGKYYHKNSNANQPHLNKKESIKFIDDKEYWTITKNGGTSDIVLTLTWNEETTAKEITAENAKDLKIVRWDKDLQIWVDEGGIVDLSTKTVTSITKVGGYGVFTLALGKENTIVEIGDVVIYNGVTPNGDGDNDYFVIENIQKYPNNTVEIYNRWGVKVFETKNYNSSGNVFKGVSEGRVTVKKNDKLPTGTYYYILKYERVTKDGSHMETKVGYLHLENN